MTDRVLRVSGRGFLPLYALAWAGAAIAYTPFLTILLPVRIEMIAGPASVHWLAVTTFIGAIAASIAQNASDSAASQHRPSATPLPPV